MKCCLSCFDHDWLRKKIKTESTETGSCSFCGSKQICLINLAELYEPFHNLLSMYSPVADVMAPWDNPLDRGEFLVDRIQWDWEVFSERLLGRNNAAELVEAILRSGWDDDSGEELPRADELYARAQPFFRSTFVEDWDEFSEEVKLNPDSDAPFYRFLSDDLARSEVTVPEGTTFFRARRCYHQNEDASASPCFGNTEMGAPPPTKAKAGRANRPGRAVLYCADEENTAVFESKPWKGLYVSIGTFKASRNLRILDLVNHLPEVNPFLAESLLYDLSFAELIAAFGFELGRPLTRDDDERDYLPCQRLCEFFEAQGYDGLRYPSAMNSNGSNVVFFPTSALDFLESALVEVSGVEIGYAVLVNYEKPCG